MALTKGQIRVSLMAFVNGFEACKDTETRRKLSWEFKDAFQKDIKDFEKSVHDAFIDNGIPDDIIKEWVQINEGIR